MPGLRVVLAEDQILLRVGLTRILESGGFEVVESVDNAPSLTRALERDDIDLAVVDVRLPPTQTTEGLECAVAARARRPLPVLVLSQYVEPLYARDLLADGAGAVGYLLKGRVSDVEAFLAAVTQVAEGGTVLDPEVVANLLDRRQRPLDGFSVREREVMSLMAEGRSNAAIAGRLHLSEGTVSKHINSIFAKLELPTASDDNRRVLAVLAWLNQD